MSTSSQRPFASTHGIIPALDLDSLDEIKRIVEQTTEIEGVVAYKLGLTLSLRLGLARAAQELKRLTALPLVYDHQKAGADLPDMSEKFARTCAEAGVDSLILFPLAGPSAVRGFVGAAMRHGLLPIVGGDLPIEDYSFSDGGYVIDDALDCIFGEAVEVGARHFVIPGNRPEKIAQHARWLVETVDGPSLVIPGIGALGGDMGACFAAADGCRAYAVIGRAIYAAGDPAEAARRFAAEALEFSR